MKSNTTTLLVRNVSHLGIGQVATTILGIFLASVIGRALEPAELGNLYIVLAISSFAYVIADWGQGTYLVREMARGRIDEPELIGSALLVRMAAIVAASGIAVAIALARGYNREIVALTVLAMAAAIPATLFAPFDSSFRSRDRMDIDAFANIVGKAITLVATAIAFRIGGGLSEVIVMQGAGNIATLLVGVTAAQRLDIAVKGPVTKLLRELVWHGAPIAAFSLVIAAQPFVEVLLLSALTGPSVVGWYGAFRSIYGVLTSPAMILLGASFPELSRTSHSIPDLRRTIDTTGRVMFIAAAFTSAALYLFADYMVAILYGHGRFEQTASLLRVSAFFVPLMFLTCLLASVIFAAGRNRALAILNIARIVVYIALSWLFIGYWPQWFGNGAIALVIIGGLVEIPTMIVYLALVPRGAVGPNTMLNVVRACTASLCTVAPLTMFQPIGLFYLTPLFALLFVSICLLTRLIVPSDLRLAMQVARSRLSASVPGG